MGWGSPWGGAASICSAVPFLNPLRCRQEQGFGEPNDSLDLENVHGGLSLKLSEVSRQTPVDFEGLRLVPQGILVIFCMHTAFQMTCLLGL